MIKQHILSLFTRFLRLKVFIFLICFTLNTFALESEKDSISNSKVSNEHIDRQLRERIKSFQYDLLNEQPEFTEEKLLLEFPLNKETNDLQENVRSFFGEIEQKKGWVEGAIGNEELTELPVGLKHHMNNVEYSIGIAKAKFTPEYTEMLVFARIKLPQGNDGRPRELFFGADKVKLSHEGGIIGDAKLVLLGNVNIPFNGGNWLLTLKGGFDYTNGNTTDRTFVTIACDGVKGMGLEGAVEFSRNLLLPIKEDGTLQPKMREEIVQVKDAKSGAYVNKKIQVKNRVRGDFKVTAPDWNDILVNINLSSFVLKKHPDKFAFKLNKAVLDFSDLRNDPTVNFPDYYHDNGLLMPSQNSWRGVYVQNFDVMLPKEFKTISSVETKSRISFGARDLIIDSNGVSGHFYADNLFSTNEGLTSEDKAWAMSLDHIAVDIAANNLTGAELQGDLILPVSKESKFRYRGLITDEEYLLAVKTTDTLKFDVFSATARLYENSGIELKVEDGKFLPKAILNGRMAITASQKKTIDSIGKKKGKEIVQFKGLEFQELILQTETPIIQAKYAGYKDEVKLANFPVSIANIVFTSNDIEAAIAFDLKLNLMGKKDKGFAADTRLAIIGTFGEEERKHRWKYDRLELERISLEANLGAIQLEGSLHLMQDNPEYGDGFSAEIKGTFGSIGPIECKAIFGKKEFRYWYLDAAVKGLKINAGPVQISGFAGGAFYKMTRKGFSSSFSPTGLSYVPDDKYGLGVKSMVFLGLVDEAVVNASAGFEILFNKRGGVSKLGFYGEAQMLKAFEFDNPVAKLTDKLKNVTSGLGADKLVNNSEFVKTFTDVAKENDSGEIVGAVSISAYMGMEHDFENNVFHAEFDLYVNVAGGVVQGRASKGRAGWGVFHVDKETWYLHMGTPEDRLGLKVGIGSFSIESGGYLMMGHKIPGSPPPPPEVAEILGVDVKELDYMRDENALGEGRGFAFGQDFKLDTGDMSALFFYARFVAGGGYDIMLKDYGDAKCKGSNDQIGINGWYANGQAYAYLQGELGIRIKLFFVKKKIPIIKAGAAVLLQAKAPNPVWMRGYLGGHYNLLGGLVKGKFRFKVTIGEECEFIDASPLGGIKVITDVTPKDGSKEIDVFAAPQAAFNLKVNEAIIVPEDDGDKTYKIILEQFKVFDDTKKEITGTLEWNSSNTSVTFVSTDILPPNTNLTAAVEVSFQELVNGVYRTVNVDGKKAVEFEERKFTTGTAPNYIPLRNIEYSYPVVDQKHFYENEHDKGYILLKRGQDYLFDDAVWKSDVAIQDISGSKQIVDFLYNEASNRIEYTMPNVEQQQEYSLIINSSPKDRTTGVSTESYNNVTTGSNDNTAEIRTNSAENVSKDGVIERLKYNFRTSNYKTFKQKIKALNATQYQWGKVYSDVLYLSVKLKPYEGFELAELVGTKHTANTPLITLMSTLTDDYFIKDMNPPMYAKYPLNNQYYFVDRDVSEYGAPPSKALRLMSSYLTSLEYDVDRTWRETTFPYYYDLPYFYKADLVDLKTQVSNDFADGKISNSHPAMSILDAKFYMMRSGKYPIKMQYVLPGGINGTQHTFNYKNPNNFR